MRYPLANLGQGVGQNLIKSSDFNSFYETSVDAATAIADVARSKGLSDDEQARVNQALGKIRDYTVPTVPPPAPCPPAGECPPAPGCATDTRTPIVVGVACLVAGVSLGALLF